MTLPPATPLEAVKHLGELTRQLRDQVRSYGEAEKDAAIKRHSADQIEARSFMRAEGSMDLRRNQAKIDADQAEQDAKVSEALVKVLKSRIRCLETEIDCARTNASTLRAEMATLGYGGDGV